MDALSAGDLPAQGNFQRIVVINGLLSVIALEKPNALAIA
jgi:hypothetical protein